MYVRLAIADTGTGIEPATLPRVMEPFFTTKEQGKGTGLGLPMARGFAQQSGGALTIASDPGLGTVVALWLPLSGTEIMQPDHSRRTAVSSSGERPRLLVVEDEELVREVIAEQLIDRGYEVIEAEGGRRALALLDAGCLVDLIITDLSMPGMDGVSLIRAAQVPETAATRHPAHWVCRRDRRARSRQRTERLVHAAAQAGYRRSFGRSSRNAVGGGSNEQR